MNNNNNNNSRMSSLRESLRNIPAALQQNHRYSNSITNNSLSSDDHNTLDLFSKTRNTLPLPSDHHAPAAATDVAAPLKLGRLSLGSNNPKHLMGIIGNNNNNNNNKMDDFLSSAAADQGGKHDYDWLLTPPGTPLVADGNQSHINNNTNNNSIAHPPPPRRSLSTTKLSSRLSVSHSETNNHATKPMTTRTTSMTRPSLSTTTPTTTYSNNKSTNILNTSSASVSSYIRPSTPTRSSTPSARSSLSRSTTPSRPRPSTDKPRPSQNSRPSTPTSRSHTSSNVNSQPNRISRPSTPTRRSTAPSVSLPSTPGTRSLPNSRNSVSRPSSPSPRVRSTGPPILLPDFPLDTPPNLRTTLPDRSISAGRSRPGVAAKGNLEQMMMTNNNSSGFVSARGRQSSPVVSRGRLSESVGRSHRTLAPPNENLGDAALDSRRELLTRKPAKTSTDTTGFGRTISKKSLDMAIKHMDIRNGSSGYRPLTGSNLFPQSIRSSNQRSQSSGVSVNKNHLFIGAVAENGNHINARFYESGSEENRNQSSAKLSNIDIYESSRYDMMLLKEDLTNSNWLHSLDDKSDQGPIFDNGFELLPEPFDPL